MRHHRRRAGVDMATEQPVYDRFYLSESHGGELFINFYVGAKEYGGWAYKHRASYTGIMGMKAAGLSYAQADLARRAGLVKTSTRIRRCKANKPLREWGYDHQFPKSTSSVG